MKLMENVLEFNVHTKDDSVFHRAFSVKKLCLARNCSRDVEAAQRDLDQKRAEGYAVHGNPSICRKSRCLVTNEDVIEVQGPHTSGEVEIVALVDTDGIMISVGSDHNDRSLANMWTESLGKIFDTAKSKQMCPAVVAKDAWKYEDVKSHWDSLKLRSYSTVSGRRIMFQDFELSALVSLDHHLKNNNWLKEDGVVIFGGTSGMLPSVPLDLYPSDFHFEVHDPVLNRMISHSYAVQSIEAADSLSL